MADLHDALVEIGTLRERIGAVTATALKAHDRQDKFEDRYREDLKSLAESFKTLTEKLDIVTEYMNKQKGLGIALYIASGALVTILVQYVVKMFIK